MDRLMRPELRALSRYGAVAAFAVLAVIGGSVIGWRLAGADTAETAVGEVSFRLGPSLRGDAEAFVPLADWGLRADAFDAPFEVRAELRSLDRPALLSAAEGELSVLEEAEDDLRAGLRAAVIRGVAWALVATLALLGTATLIWRGLRPRWLLLAAGGTVAIAALGASLLAARMTFDVRAFESPTYFAGGAELRRILEVAEDERVRSQYGSTFASVLRSISAVLVEPGVGQERGRDLYVASDLHANPVVIDPLARWFGNAPLLFVGDYGQRGGETESELLAPRVSALSEYSVAVSGNHDTRRLMDALVSEGVQVIGEEGVLGESGAYLGGPLIDVEGLSVAGYSDPFEWQGSGDPESRPITFEDLTDPEAEFEEELTLLVSWFDDLPRRPDIVMVHQAALARGLAEILLERRDANALTVITGHDHIQRVDRYGEVIVVDGGTVGAGGIFDAGREEAGFAELHFSGDSPRLRSVDLIAVEPFSGRAHAARVVIDALCPTEETCSFEPSGLHASAID